jgi:hypothetical protein
LTEKYTAVEGLADPGARIEKIEYDSYRGVLRLTIAQQTGERAALYVRTYTGDLPAVRIPLAGGER